MKTLFLLAVLFNCLASFGQDTGRMETDRPDQTESPFITRKKYIQSEIGFNIEQDNHLTTVVFPTILWKYGLSKRFEFRVITEINVQETPLLVPQGNEVLQGLVPLKLGGKLSLWEEKGIVPKTSVIAHAAFPKLAGKDFRASKVAPEFRFAMQHTISAKIGLGYNIGAEWDGETSGPAWIYTIGPGLNLGKNGYMYVELFGDYKDGESNHNFDGGFAYYVNDNLKLDISSGFNLRDSKQYYLAAGISFRFRVF
jgi:hypothetical protein